jgi:hypothetical protein
MVQKVFLRASFLHRFYQISRRIEKLEKSGWENGGIVIFLHTPILTSTSQISIQIPASLCSTFVSGDPYSLLAPLYLYIFPDS